jgi:hypothetical protein
MGKLSSAEVLRLRATSAVSPDPSVRRSAQDDDFAGVSKASGRGHLPSFNHTTRKLVVIEIAAGQQKQPDFVQRCSAQSSQQVTSSKAPCSANLDSSETLQPLPSNWSVASPSKFDHQAPLLYTRCCCLSSQSRWILSCRSGGIGRRAWFRSMYSQGCGGSSPFFGTSLTAKYLSLQVNC